MENLRPLFSRKNYRRGEKGFALLVVIMVMLLVSFLAIQLVMEVRTETKVAFNTKNRMIGLMLAEAGLSLGLFHLIPDYIQNLDEEEVESFHYGQVYEEILPTGRVEYYAVSETGKIDLNTYPQELMQLFLEYHGLDEEQIAVIQDSLLDWRDNDDLHHLNGAEKDTYEAFDDPYIPRNGSIEDPEEFFLVNGTEALIGKFEAENVFTVHNQNSRIEFNSLTPEMLEFITAGDQEKIEMYHAARAELNQHMYLDRNHALLILGEERFSQVGGFLTYHPASNTTRVFQVVATGQAGYKNSADEALKRNRPGRNGDNLDDEERKKHWPGTRISVLVQMLGIRIQVLAWRERYV